MFMYFPWIFGIFFVLSSLVSATENSIDYLDCGETVVCTHSFVIPPKFVDARQFSEGLASVKIEVEVEEVGVSDLIDLLDSPSVSESLGLASKSIKSMKQISDKHFSSWGYINKAGKFVIEPEFTLAQSFSEGLAFVAKTSLQKAVLFPGTPHKSISYWGYINRNNQSVLSMDPEKVQTLRSFKEGLDAVQISDGKWGYINKNGDFFIDPVYDSAGDFSEGLSWVEVSGEYGYISRKTGEFFIKPQFDVVGNFNEGLAPVKTGNKWGYISKETKEFFIRPQFDAVENFNEGLAPVIVGNKWGYISRETRKFVIELAFDGIEDIENFNEGLAPVKINGQYGYINKTGWFVIEPQFDNAKLFSEGLAAVKKGNKWGYIEVIKL